MAVSGDRGVRGWWPFGVLVGIVLLFSAWTEANRPVVGPHGRLEMALYERADDTLLWVVGEYFATAGRCKGCHGHDMNGLASIDAQGRDVNVVDDWRSTMMANSARDPFFLAKVSHEVIVNPEHQTAIENKCLSCHAPLGMHEERLLGHAPFTIAMLDTSVFGKDGVSCLSCHMQSEATAGSFFSGELEFDSARVYGPYADDQINPAIMTDFVGWTPGLGSHILNSKVCAGCHTLITQTIDLDGDLTGDHFVEQATYHEWLNSIYSDNGTQCNTCHMPRIDDPIILAAEYAFLNPQTPFGLHHLAGANVHMLELLKANREVLHIPATEVQFDSTIARTERMLRERTLDVQLSVQGRTADTAFFSLRLENKAGHRFPSGYPSRRAFVEFVVLDAAGDTVFKSGRVDGTYEVEGHDAGYEPHYDMIDAQDKVQIYELVMGDVLGNVTTVLERAKDPLKDNRLVPFGFSTSHASYDTTRIAGLALSDANFNRNTLGEEGSGTDLIQYHVPLNGTTTAVQAFARIYYQPVPPAWNMEMFAHNSVPIDAFRDMLAASDGTPHFVAGDSVLVGPVGIEEPITEQVRVFPNPTADGWCKIAVPLSKRAGSMVLFNARGERVAFDAERSADGWRIRLPATPGMYLLQVEVSGTLVLKRLVRQ